MVIYVPDGGFFGLFFGPFSGPFSGILRPFLRPFSGPFSGLFFSLFSGLCSVKKNSRTSLSGRITYSIILSQAVSSPFLTNLWNPGIRRSLR